MCKKPEKIIKLFDELSEDTHGFPNGFGDDIEPDGGRLSDDSDDDTCSCVTEVENTDDLWEPSPLEEEHEDCFCEDCFFKVTCEECGEDVTEEYKNFNENNINSGYVHNCN